MIKSKNKSEIIIDLTGPDGNAFMLLGKASRLAKQLGWDKGEIDSLIKRMMAGNYDELINEFDKHFGHFVTLLK